MKIEIVNKQDLKLTKEDIRKYWLVDLSEHEITPLRRMLLDNILNVREDRNRFFIEINYYDIKPLKQAGRYAPNKNNIYYEVKPDGSISNKLWINDLLDFALWNMGNCFKTEEEAEANKAEMLEKYKAIQEEMKECQL